MKSLVVVKDQCKFHAVGSRATEFQRFPWGWEQAHPPMKARLSLCAGVEEWRT